MVDHAVLQCLLRGEPTVAVRVFRDLLKSLPGVFCNQFRHLTFRLRELLRLNSDIRCGTTDAS